MIADRGIYILANDNVSEQLIALLNSIRTNYSKTIPVQIIAFDEKMAQVKSVVANYSNVAIFDDTKVKPAWESFVSNVWGQRSFGRHSMGVHWRFFAFSGVFKNFVYLDADTLLMDSLDPVFEKLEEVEFVSYDFQYKHPRHVFNIEAASRIFSSFAWEQRIFCSGFFASRAEVFSQDCLTLLQTQLLAGETEVLYDKAPDQSLLNYMVIRSQIRYCNLALEWPASKRTGNAVTSTHFQSKDHVVFDHDKRLMYLHYIGIPSDAFKAPALASSSKVPYFDVFTHYRNLKISRIE